MKSALANIYISIRDQDDEVRKIPLKDVGYKPGYHAGVEDTWIPDDHVTTLQTRAYGDVPVSLKMTDVFARVETGIETHQSVNLCHSSGKQVIGAIRQRHNLG